MISSFFASHTIFALSSARGRAGISVIRVSGPQAKKALLGLMGENHKLSLQSPRRAVSTRIKDPITGEVLDNGLVIWFPSPASFTGEDVVELHIHGGFAVISGVMEALKNINGFQIAEPGEFTRRAFENGKMDLTSAEGLADLIESETVAQRRQALRQLEGELGKIYEAWRQRLLGALAHSEASIDFADEDLPDDIESKAFLEIVSLENEIANHLKDKRRGERLREGALVTIIGPPNAGKSSLFNLIVKREASIISKQAGTTRDVIEAFLMLDGYPVTLADTAGLREGGDAIEVEGIRRARKKAENSDLKIAVFDIKNWHKLDSKTLELIDSNTLIVINKCDLEKPNTPPKIKNQPAFVISALTGIGVDELIDAVTKRIVHKMDVSASPALTRARHREALEDCRNALERCLKNKDLSSELAAEDLRIAARCLGRITGCVDVDDVLDFIFQNFCIGK